ASRRCQYSSHHQDVRLAEGRRSMQRLERSAHLLREQLRLLQRGEVAALVGFVEVRDGGVSLLDPAARGAEDLAGKLSEADRDGNSRRSLASRSRKRLRSSALPVRPGRRGPGGRQPVERDVVEDVVAGEIPRGLAVDEGVGGRG